MLRPEAESEVTKGTRSYVIITGYFPDISKAWRSSEKTEAKENQWRRSKVDRGPVARKGFGVAFQTLDKWSPARGLGTSRPLGEYERHSSALVLYITSCFCPEKMKIMNKLCPSRVQGPTVHLGMEKGDGSESINFSWLHVFPKPCKKLVTAGSWEGLVQCLILWGRTFAPFST